jgi:hypothetical protein
MARSAGGTTAKETISLPPQAPAILFTVDGAEAAYAMLAVSMAEKNCRQWVAFKTQDNSLGGCSNPNLPRSFGKKVTARAKQKPFLSMTRFRKGIPRIIAPVAFRYT